MVANRAVLYRSAETKKPLSCDNGSLLYGGERGIRTPGGFDPTSDFKSGALNQALPALQEVRILKANGVDVKTKIQNNY